MSSSPVPPGQTPRVSFRDPAGQLLQIEERILRVVHATASAGVIAMLASRTIRRGIDAGRIVRTEPLDGEAALDLPALPAGGLLLEHERIPFASFPYEWCPEMLHAAGELTLELAEEALDEQLGLKDATPYNLLFQGTVPVFVDLLSFEQRKPGDARWLPYAQFVRTFVLPLLAHQQFGVSPADVFLTRRDGLQPEEVTRMCGPLRRLLPPFLWLSTLPTWLASRAEREGEALYRPEPEQDPEKAAFVLRCLYRQLRKALQTVKPAPARRSTWLGYLGSGSNYTDQQFQAKEAFCLQVLSEVQPDSVLDVGCNTGHFSALAARSGARVVGIDFDPEVVSATWRRARAEALDILPLVVDLARPTPATGWANRECASFLERAHGRFDLVLMLALIHHLLVTERIPLEAIFDLAAGLTRNYLLVEFVSPQDSMFRRIARGNGSLFEALTSEAFERAARERFEIRRVQRLEGTERWLYLLQRRAEPAS